MKRCPCSHPTFNDPNRVSLQAFHQTLDSRAWLGPRTNYAPARVATDVRVAERVTWHGAVAHDRLPEYYRGATLCVQASRFESQGMVVLEAQSCAWVLTSATLELSSCGNSL